MEKYPEVLVSVVAGETYRQSEGYETRNGPSDSQETATKTQLQWSGYPTTNSSLRPRKAPCLASWLGRLSGELVALETLKSGARASQ